MMKIELWLQAIWWGKKKEIKVSESCIYLRCKSALAHHYCIGH